MTLLTRVVAPLWIGIVALAQILGGMSTFPTWLDRPSHWIGVEPEPILRAMIAAQLAGLCVMVLLGRFARLAAIIVLSAMCFVALAELSKQFTDAGISIDVLGSIMVLLISGALLAAIGLPETALRPPPRASGSSLLSTAAAILASIVLAAVVHLQPGPPPPPTPPEASGPTASAPTPDEHAGHGHDLAPEVVPDFSVPGELVRAMPAEELPQHYFMEPDAWTGQPVEETNWLQYLPDETQAQLKSGEHIVVFHNPNDRVSHALFDEPLSVVNPSKIVAVRVPPWSRQPAPRDLGLGPVHCDGCRMVALPSGPLWSFPQGPVIFRIVNGTVRCNVMGMDEMALESCLYAPAEDQGG